MNTIKRKYNLICIFSALALCMSIAQAEISYGKCTFILPSNADGVKYIRAISGIPNKQSQGGTPVPYLDRDGNPVPSNGMCGYNSKTKIVTCTLGWKYDSTQRAPDRDERGFISGLVKDPRISGVPSDFAIINDLLASERISVDGNKLVTSIKGYINWPGYIKSDDQSGDLSRKQMKYTYGVYLPGNKKEKPDFFYGTQVTLNKKNDNSTDNWQIDIARIATGIKGGCSIKVKATCQTSKTNLFAEESKNPEAGDMAEMQALETTEGDADDTCHDISN